jgi:surface antigen
MIRPFSMVLAIACLAVAGHSAAAGFGFMAKGTMSRFSEADMKLFEDALGKALAAETTGVPVEWKNEQTGASGVITPRRIFRKASGPCSEVRIVNRHKTSEDRGVYSFCQQDGRWSLAQ